MQSYTTIKKKKLDFKSRTTHLNVHLLELQNKLQGN